MAEFWEPTRKNQKQYPHFDKPLSLSELASIANCPEKVAKNAFFPFLEFKKSWIPFRADGRRNPKTRLIRFASRRDSAIYSRYRELISKLYDRHLQSVGLDEAVIAYRKIPVEPNSTRGKCNIHFAREAFEKIVMLEDCCAVVMDISKYFEHIDHQLLEQCWKDILALPKLPPDHYAVFKSLTQYRWVDLSEALTALEFKGENGRLLIPKKEQLQLCSPEEFRSKIADADLIQKNDNDYGIPQGAPLSDVLANLYLLEFDKTILNWVQAKGGYYRRYSDDILIILPGGLEDGRKAFNFSANQIKQFGQKLEIKAEKTAIVRYFSEHSGLTFECDTHCKSRNGLEYLGFRFDGKKVYLRDSTVSRLFRKMTFYCRREAIALVKRYPGQPVSFIRGRVNFEVLDKKYGRVEGFEPQNKKKWTFWTYGRRASKIFGSQGAPILRQIKNYRSFLRRTIDSEINKQHARITVD